MKLLNSLYTIQEHRQHDGIHDFDIRLDAGHFIYQAHFPGEPITPGVCIMQIALELMEESVNVGLSVTCVKNVKFLRIISPVEMPELCYSVQKIVVEGETVKAQIVVSAADGVYAKLSMICQKA